MIRLQAGLHPFRLYSIHGKDAARSLVLEWSGPGVERQPIRDDVFVHAKAATAAP